MTPPSEEWRTLVFIGYYTGARMGDCLGLTWSAFDLGDTPKLTYQQKKTGKGSKGWVTIAVHPALKKRLLEWRLASKAGTEGPVLPGLTATALGVNTGPGPNMGSGRTFGRLNQKAHEIFSFRFKHSQGTA